MKRNENWTFRFEIFRDKRNAIRIRLLAKNRRNVLVSDVYQTTTKALYTLSKIKKALKDGQII